MDGRTGYSRIVKMFESLEGDDIQMHLDNIKNMIRMNLGTSEKIVVENLRLLSVMGFIRENSEKPFYYFINKNGKM